jgi:hypothetical protein
MSQVDNEQIQAVLAINEQIGLKMIIELSLALSL